MAKHVTAQVLFQKSTGTSALTGTVSSSGTALTGTGTAFDTELIRGDVIQHPDDSSETRVITAIASATGATINEAFSTDLSGDTVLVRTMAEVPNVTGLDGLERVVDEIEASTWSDGLDKVFLPGRADQGEATGEIVYDPGLASHLALETDQTAGTVRSWRLWVYTTGRSADPPDNSNHRLIFNAFIKSLGNSFPGDGYLGGTLNLRVTGKKVWVAGA